LSKQCDASYHSDGVRITSALCGVLRTRTVCIAVVWALTVLWACVPTLALVHLFCWLAYLGQPVKHIALAAAKLVGLLIVVAGEIVSAVCGVGVDRVGLQKILRSYDISPGTAEPVNFIKNSPFTQSGQLTSLLLPDTAANLDIKNERVWTRELKSTTIVALNVFITH